MCWTTSWRSCTPLANTPRRWWVQPAGNPRGHAAGRGAAVLAGRGFVIPEDVKRIAVAALGHRVVVRPELWISRITGDEVVAEVMELVPTPSARS